MLKKMSHFKYSEQPSSSEPPRTTAIEVEVLIHWGTLVLLLLGIFVITYLLISKCAAYWTYKIEQWRYSGRKKRDSEDDDEDDY